MAINEEKLRKLKQSLIEEKNNLEKDLIEIAKPVNQKKGDYETIYEDIGSDKDDNATEVNQYTQNLSIENNLEKKLQAVLDALAKIEAGTYGVCEKCQQEIPIERLTANPSAKTCLHC